MTLSRGGKGGPPYMWIDFDRNARRSPALAIVSVTGAVVTQRGNCCALVDDRRTRRGRSRDPRTQFGLAADVFVMMHGQRSSHCNLLF
jgi:hypothetical protein